ncbi:TadE/TadG family type IV pilus assembly protein [Parvibaculum sedimenti]|nr:TadE/TadG family type IV pilus assembly protein [Parvibaculum sedimenti]
MRRNDAGTAAIEFGLLAPVLLILLAGLVEVGFSIRESMMVHEAVEAGASYATQYGWDSTGISNAITGATAETGITATPSPQTFCGCPTATGVTTTLCTATCTGGGSPGQYVRVDATIPHTTILSYLGLPIPATLTAHAIVRIQ